MLAKNVRYSKEQNAMNFPNGYAGVTIIGNVVLGEGAKHGSSLGRGIQDFQSLTWDVSQRDATPAADAPFNQDADAYRVPIDIAGKDRSHETITSGAAIR